MDRRLFLTAAASLAALPSNANAAASSPIEEVITSTEFSGSVLVAQGRKIVLRKGFGLADRSFETPCGPDTAYRIASITKLMTATLVMQLVEAGRIDLDQPIRTYIADYKGPAAGQVTVRQLLNHSSGIENFDKGLTSYADAAARGMPAYQLPHRPRALMDQFASGPLVNPPGAAFDYNNADYVILGQIIEAVEGDSYEAVLSRRVLAPPGLKSTGMAKHAGVVARLAPTYYKDEAAPLANDMPVYPENWYAAGGLYSTCDDLLAFSNALYGGRLMSAGSLKALLTPGLDEYGFGLWVSELEVDGRKHRFAQRPGRIMGANTLLLRMLDDDVTIIILGNTNLMDTDRLGFRLARRVLGSEQAASS
ncbi:serine hydrolase domain-containing protein [Caulobacter sp. 17J65-9]|uniref:serine hydrolase n=1 Tax=Caulobacter sp. 17J65-9 TaxID=2709382 RepID=UPI0013C54E3F|nr:beta-lactamase family protein [Caulobacter sp. 17J65-9]